MALEVKDNRLPLKDLKRIVLDLEKPRAAIDWIDLICCVVAGGTGLYLSMPFPDNILQGSPVAIVGFLITVLALYRASYFNHELSHHSNQLPGFEIGWERIDWNPPSSFRLSCIRIIGTIIPCAPSGQTPMWTIFPQLTRYSWRLAALLVITFLLPLAYIARFSVLLIAAWVSPAARYWVDVRASSLGILGLSRRGAPTAAERRVWRIQEFACGAYLLINGVLLLTGILPLTSILHFYAIIVVVLFLHGIRIMVGHRYEFDGKPRNRVDQVLDSYNFPRPWLLTSLLAPLGFNLHALHHLFPHIPYHNMREAHRRITRALPKDSIYHSVEGRSYFTEVGHFILRSSYSA